MIIADRIALYEKLYKGSGAITAVKKDFIPKMV